MDQRTVLTLWLLRHGATAGNEKKRYIGRGTDEPLSVVGREALKKAGDSFVPQRVYTSSLRRAKETAQILFPGALTQQDPRLDEMDFGAFENKNYQELAGDRAYCSWVDGGCKDSPPMGENLEAFIHRVAEGFGVLVDRSFVLKETKIAVVAHGGSIMAVMSQFALPQQDYFRWQVGNGQGFQLDIDPTQWEKYRKITHWQKLEKEKNR